jgi:hypothetical protein
MLRPLPEARSHRNGGFVIFSFLAALAEMIARVRLANKPDGYLLAPVGFPLQLV